jgi:hypothetical protein
LEGGDALGADVMNLLFWKLTTSRAVAGLLQE